MIEYVKRKMQTVERTQQLFENMRSVKERVGAAARRAGRNPSAVRLLAVTKYALPEDVAALLEKDALTDIGESRVQDAARKFSDPALSSFLKGTARHMIGHLQSNKAAKAAELFDWIDSLDSLKTAQALDRRAVELGKKIPVLVQIKLTETETRHGIAPEQAPGLLDAIRKLPNLDPRGYMGIAPETDDTGFLRPVFRNARKIFDRDFPSGDSTTERPFYLSLGMSGDFEVAVEEGSNLPRIGSLIFGPGLRPG
ncbi:MAG: YggS family pyridoxal phosphate-dependent enzyme [bacterium]